jgi:hypothetical protein
MSATASSDETRLAALESAYRALVARWYPSSWLEGNGDALVGTLMDAAEGRGTTVVTAAVRFDLARRGLAVRVFAALEEQTRARVASISVGVTAAFAVVLVLTSQPPSNLLHRVGTALVPVDLEPARLLSLTPFLLAWVVVVGAAFSTLRRTRFVLLGVAVLVTLASSSAWFTDPLSAMFRPSWGAWWSTFLFLAPASVANLLLLLSATLLGSVARPRLWPALASGVLTAAILIASLTLRTGRLSSLWPDWFWTPTWDAPGGPISIPLLLVGAIIGAAILKKTSRSKWAVALCVSALPFLLGWIAEVALNPQIALAM